MHDITLDSRRATRSSLVIIATAFTTVGFLGATIRGHYNRLLTGRGLLRPVVALPVLAALAATVAFTHYWGAVVLFVGLSASIAVHEAAHAGVAALCGARVSQYFVGFGPKLVAGRFRGTECSLRAFPFLGGAIALDTKTEHKLNHRRWIALAAVGPIANLLLGYALLVGVQLVDTDQPLPVVVSEVNHTYSSIATDTLGTVVRLPQIVIASVSGAVTGESPDVTNRVMSPVSMAQIGQQADELGGIAMVLRIVAVINLALGLMNLLPIPPLDGSLITKHLFEGVASRIVRRTVAVPAAAFKAVAYTFTGIILVVMGSAMLVDLLHPIAI